MAMTHVLGENACNAFKDVHVESGYIDAYYGRVCICGSSSDGGDGGVGDCSLSHVGKGNT